jgi:hypothetical protein
VLLYLSVIFAIFSGMPGEAGFSAHRAGVRAAAGFGTSLKKGHPLQVHTVHHPRRSPFMDTWSLVLVISALAGGRVQPLTTVTMQNKDARSPPSKPSTRKAPGPSVDFASIKRPAKSSRCLQRPARDQVDGAGDEILASIRMIRLQAGGASRLVWTVATHWRHAGFVIPIRAPPSRARCTPWK